MCSESESNSDGGGDGENFGGSNGGRLSNRGSKPGSDKPGGGNPGGAKKSAGGNTRNKNSRPPAGKPGIPPIRKGQKRVKPLDARALENLLRWSIDLVERQRNLLETALEVVTNDADG